MIFFPLFISLLSILLYLVAFSPFVLAQEVATIRKVPGLQEPVEILRDRWGISYIYAKHHKPLKSFWYLLKRAAK
jgi:penicillin amidase